VSGQGRFEGVRPSSSAGGAAPDCAESSDVQGSASERQRRAFAAMAAHELRAPVHAIQSYLSVILRERVGPLNAVQRDFLTTMQQSGRRLERLIDDLQVMITYERGFALRIEPTDVLAQATASCRELAPSAENYGMRVSVEPRGTGPWVIDVDPLRLDQIVINLVENAIRYAHSGTTVHVRLRRSPSRLLCVVHNVTDRVIPDDVRDWFKPFERGESHTGDERPGLGLGLPVVQHLVEAHRGRMLARARGQNVAIGFVLPVGGG
jgi:signal transduction histidine kinase